MKMWERIKALFSEWNNNIVEFSLCMGITLMIVVVLGIVVGVMEV